ncbi:MAG: pyridoxal-phosphate dependent enzyme [Polyangiaceae bacterium]|nr:pyridoxal-phosphate dependent enzyme [Polyangiaceae bacterium]
MLAALEAIPSLGWVTTPSPLETLPSLEQRLRLERVLVKRDDRLAALRGGSKPRKLTYLLAAPECREATALRSVGAIGSGHLVAMTEAARVLGRELRAHCFWEPLWPGVLDNLAFTASGPTALAYRGSRVALALREPWVPLGRARPPLAGIPAGGTSPLGAVGLVRAALELAIQLVERDEPAPERLYVALGSGGTVAGLALGLALAGLPTTVRAVSAVERPFTTRGRLLALVRETAALLAAAGVPLPAGLAPRPIEITHELLGRGYTHPPEAARAACDALHDEGIAVEAIYTGRALAALLAERGGGARRVLYWHTAHAHPLPHAEGWRERLPSALAERLRLAEAGRSRGRRRALVAAGAVAAAVAVGVRLTGYPPLPPGRVLASWELHVVAAAAEALLPPAPAVVSWEKIARNVDAYLVGMPASLVRDVHALIAAVEHGTWLAPAVRRFSELAAAEREAHLRRLEGLGGMGRLVARGVRDFCLLGYYQEPATWAALGYEGPLLGPDPQPPRPRAPRYAALVAPPGALPRGAAR